MTEYLWIAGGSVLGALSRYLLSKWLLPLNGFPIATLLVNATGCLLAGLVGGLGQDKTSPLFLFCMVGFLGSYTTFSAFGVDTIELFHNGSVALGGINILLQVILGLLLAWFGFVVARLFFV